MPDWSIKIVPAKKPTKNAPAAFKPDLKGTKTGDPLKVQGDDIVTWNNTTGDRHWPWQTDQNYVPFPDNKVQGNATLNLSNPIPPSKSSSPNYNVPDATATIYYCCKYHPNERGTIVVTAAPQGLPNG